MWRDFYLIPFEHGVSVIKMLECVPEYFVLHVSCMFYAMVQLPDVLRQVILTVCSTLGKYQYSFATRSCRTACFRTERFYLCHLQFG
jgi:hypothetical protein